MVIGIFIIYLFKLLIGGIILKKQQKLLYKKKLDIDKTKFSIILPVYKEQERIGNCIKNIKNIEWNAERLDVYISTTEKERIDGDDTETYIKNLISTNEYKYKYYIIRYPRTDGSMAEQINYTYKFISNKYDVVCIYNADSIIPKNILKEVAFKFKQTNVNYIQQRAIYSNYDGINIFSIGYSIYQSAFEMRNNIIEDFCNWGNNLVGRGLFIRNNKKREYIYPVDFYCEDMALAFELIARGENISGVTQFEINEPPMNLRDILNQQYVWFHTAIKVKKMVDYSLRCGGKWSCRLLYKVMNRIFLNILWLLTSPILIFLIFNNIYFLGYIFFYCISVVVILKFLFDNKTGHCLLLDAISLIIYLCVVSLGPYNYFVKKILSFINDNIVDEKYKTPRT